MIKKHSVIVLLFSGTVSVFILVYAYLHRKSTTDDCYSIQLFEGQEGLGYDIYRDDSILIHQETIPALPTKSGFETKEAAMSAAKLVTEKLRNREHPALTCEEVTNLIKEVKQAEGR